jgi:hypothetical protein
MKLKTDVPLRATTIPVFQKRLQERFHKPGEKFTHLLRSLLFAMLLAIAALPLSFFALLQEKDSAEC